MPVTARLTTAAVEAAVLTHQTVRVTEAGIEVAVGTSTDYLSQYFADSGTATESAQTQVIYSQSDSGTIVESQSLMLFVSSGDAGTGDDSIAFPVLSVTGADVGTGTSTEDIAASVLSSEIAFLSDSPDIQGAPAAADVGTLSEATEIFVAFASPATDSGSSSEAESVADYIRVNSADDGAGSEGIAIALIDSEIGTSVETESSTATISATDSAQQNEILVIAVAALDARTGSETASRIIVLDVSAELDQSRDITLNAYLLKVIDSTVTLPRAVDITATGDLVTIVDVQASLDRTVAAAPLGDAVTTAEGTAHLASVRTIGVTTDGTDILLPEVPTMQMSLFNDTLIVVAGGQAIVNVSLGEPDDIVSFYWDSSSTPVQTAQLDDSGNLVAASIIVPVDMTSGTHTLKATGADFGLALLDIPVTSDIPPAITETSTADLPPPPPSSQRWNLYDPFTQETYLLPIGPSQIDAPYLDRNLTTAGTTNPLGQQVVWEGGRRASQWTCSGRLVDGSQIDALRSWRGRPYRVWLYDPLGRAWLIKVTGVELVPVRDIEHDMTHDWTLHALIYGRKS